MTGTIKLVLALLAAFLLSLAVFDGISHATLSRVPMVQPVSRLRNQARISRIIGVLESRIGSHRLPQQAKAKLADIPADDLRLIAALCDRIAASDDHAGTDIAVLLAAALIVLS